MGGNLTARFEEHGGNTSRTLTVRGVTDVGLNLVYVVVEGLASRGVLVVEGRKLTLFALGAGTLVHEGLDGLLVATGNLHLVQGRVDHLSVDTLELAVSTDVDLNVLVLGEELTDELEDAEEGLVEGALLHVGALGHGGEVGLDHRSQLDLSLALVLSHLGVVVEAKHVEELVVDLDVSDALVVHQWLEADRTEVREVYSALHLNLTVAPTMKFKRLVTDNDRGWAPLEAE